MSTTSPLIGITAEWNPFHAGHSAMIDIIKKAYPQAPLIAIMSGAFVQRGEPALLISGRAPDGPSAPAWTLSSNFQPSTPFRAQTVSPAMPPPCSMPWA